MILKKILNSPETIIALLISYTQIRNKMFKNKKDIELPMEAPEGSESDLDVTHSRKASKILL